jgi:hypothetical protein
MNNVMFNIHANVHIWNNFIGGVVNPNIYSNVEIVDQELLKYNGKYIAYADTHTDLNSYIKFDSQEDMIQFILRFS